MQQPEHDVGVRTGVGDDHLRHPAAVLGHDRVDRVQTANAVLVEAQADIPLGADIGLIDMQWVVGP